MLDYMRKNSNSMMIMLLFGIIIFVFATNFGPWAGNPISATDYAAKVNNDTITMASFRLMYSNQFNQMKQFIPSYTQEQAERDGLAERVIEQLISKELIFQVAKKHNFYVGARTLAENIKRIVFGEKENFNKDEYKKRIEGYFQMSVSQFEEQLAKDLASQEIADIFETAIYFSTEDLKESFIEQNNKISLEFIKVQPDYFASAEPSKENIDKFITDNYAKIEQYYKEHLSEFNQEEQIKASHILIKSDKDDQNKASKKEKIESILKRINAGEDFATIAKNESEDPGSKINGGDLGFFTRGMMVEEFSKAAFALKIGEISKVVESPFGFHIIKVTEQKPAQSLSVKDSEVTIATKLVKKEEQSKKAKELATKALEQLNHGTSIENISLPGLVNKQQNNQKDKLVTNEPVADVTSHFSSNTSYIPKIGLAPEVIKEAFALSLENKVAKNIVESEGSFYAIRLKEKIDADLTKFDSEKENLQRNLLMTQKRQFMQQYISFLKNNAKIKINNDLMRKSV